MARYQGHQAWVLPLMGLYLVYLAPVVYGKTNRIFFLRHIHPLLLTYQILHWFCPCPKHFKAKSVYTNGH